MKEPLRIKLGDTVDVAVECGGNIVGKISTSSIHNVDEAIEEAMRRVGAGYQAVDCVFDIRNLSTGVSERYRINAHGHKKLIV